MSGKSSHPTFYTLLQRRLHWLVIVLLMGQFALQNPMREAMAAIQRQETLGFVQFLVTTAHSWGGICIAVVMVWRWQLRKQVVPLNGGHLSRLRSRWVNAHHVGLYAVTIAMATTGAMHHYLEWSFAARLHIVGKWLLFALIALHVTGALVHMRQGSTVLRRMMGRNSTP